MRYFLERIKFFYEKVGLKELGVVSLIFISLPLSATLGEMGARRRVGFLVVNTSPERVVLAKYGNNLMCSTFDRKSRMVFPGFIILNLEEKNGLVFRGENIGPLRLTTSKPTN